MKKSVFLSSVLTLVILAGCILLQPFKIPGNEVVSKWNHKVHTKNAKCTKCHGKVSTLGKASMPNYKTCKSCHEDELQKPEEDADEDEIQEVEEDNKKIKTFLAFVKERRVNGKLTWISVPATFQEARFSHKIHLTSTKFKFDQKNCTDCHKKISQSENILANYIPRMDNCISCHTEKKLGPTDDCQQCHKETRRTTKPSSHKMMWKQIHGDNFKRDGKQCFYCHSENWCITCHQNTPPASHGNQWRNGGHGYVAEMNREKCAMCHTSDSCVRCHQNTRPVTHTSGWGRSTYTHCVSCHFPLEDNSCRACHRATPDHATAPQMPATVSVHPTTTACFSCHPNVKHPTSPNTAECLFCHKRP